MKKLKLDSIVNNPWLLLGAFIYFALSGFQTTKTSIDGPKFVYKVDFEQEKQQIMQVIENESAAFWKKDFDAYADLWVHEDYIRTLGWWAAGGVTVVEGWEERCKRTKSHMENSPAENPTATDVRRANINLRIFHDVAWLTFDQYGEDTGDPTMDMPGLSRETRILEKHNGEWKIVYVGWLLEG
ncbi:YybH family protein [Pararhodonellum marinum]|uniref:YybH family protein n=1 Tax=Pararhodonellum marinum TaxID=2755358 RepID=UPI00188F76FA|nr:nuclear transport factor 2 family protein [Pararhodonellum marinum]